MNESYGVTRLILLNSGNYLTAEIELDRPIHLAANNNRGKSTLVNSLQFLYINDEKRMRFGKRSIDDSRKHYFGYARSYIIYECRTPTGPQCLIVRGRGSMNSNKYERYLVEGPYRQADFVDEEQQLLDFEDVRGMMADRNLTQIKSTELWSTLAAQCPKNMGTSAGRLGLLPIKQRDQYLAFCDVFVRLLSLQDTDAKTLRRLVIESHAGDIQERRIDIPSEYREEFAQAERAENELAFIRQASSWITNGIELRGQLDEIRAQLESVAPTITAEASFVQAAFGRIEKNLICEQEKLTKQLTTAKEAERTATKTEWEAEKVFAQKEKAWNKLQFRHTHWEGYKPAFIEQMRFAVATLNRDIVRCEDELRQAETYDLALLRKNVMQLNADVERKDNFLANKEQTFLAALQRKGFNHKEIAELFQIGNAELLELVVDEDIHIHDIDKLAERIKAIHTGISASFYEDDIVKINLNAISQVPSESLFDLAQLKEQIRMNRERLSAETSRLKTAEDQQAAKDRLDAMRKEHKEKTEELLDYDNYILAWHQRAQFQIELDRAKTTLDEAAEQIVTTSAATVVLENLQVEMETKSNSLTTSQTQLNNAIIGFNEQLRASNIQWRPESPKPNDLESEVADQKSNTNASELIVKKLSELTRSLKSRQPIEQELLGLERNITEASRNTKSEPRNFNEPDQEWLELAEEVQAGEQLEVSVRNAWDQLFKPLGARMRGVVDGIERIKRAVERLQRGLRTYQVSNLAAVEISVDEVSDVYNSIEALAAADSLFNDPDQIDQAKKKLKRMIEAAQVIEIESLFELKIGIQETGGLKRRAGSLDEIGSTGTGMTVKAMIFIQLIRAIASDNKYRMFFYIDGVGELDDGNLSATAELAVSQGILHITADPRLHLEPLAHPQVTVYSLGQYSADHPAKGRFYIDATRTYVAERFITSDERENVSAK